LDRAISLEARRIELSMELPFQLGRARIDPRSHEVAWTDESRRLQPLTMKVLVALHDRMGEVVTRDELVERCWDGRFVGEDVVNRCISLLRRVAAESGGFEIQTVPRAGYRLIETPPAADAEQAAIAADETPSQVSVRRRRWIAVAAGLAVVSGACGLLAFERFTQPEPDAVMLTPFDVAGNAPLARTFAAAVFSDVNGALTAANVDVVDPESRRSARVAFTLGGRAELSGSDLHLTAELQDARDQTVLWSTAFTRPATQVQAMQEQVADNLARVLHCALDTWRQPDGEQLDRDTIKLYLKACALAQAADPPADEIQGLLQQVTARQPRFAEGWARLAFFSAGASFVASPRDQAALRGEARAAAQSALRLNPRSALAHEALTELDLGHVPFAQIYREDQVNLSLDPNTDYITGDGGELLLRMGRVSEGLERSRRAVGLDPFSPVETSDLIVALVDNSRFAEAYSTLQRALRIWPDDTRLRVAHLDYEARFGTPDTALAILIDPDQQPQKVRDMTLELYRRLAETRKSGQPTARRAFIAWLKREVVSGQAPVDFAVPHLAEFGDVDGAFRLAFAAPADIINIDPEFLWEPEALPLRRDPRFIALAAKFHVADIWTSTGLWPDFCSTPNWPYNCKAEAARLPLNAWPKQVQRQ
jgi:DNA-binding winged helix-turn-helix (wHTH) protein/TolB-like protein